jgi:hypothetical protein
MEKKNKEEARLTKIKEQQKKEEEEYERIREELKGKNYTFDSKGNVIVINQVRPEFLPSYKSVCSLFVSLFLPFLSDLMFCFLR